MGPAAEPHRRQQRPLPDAVAGPTAYGFVPPKVYAWNIGVQHKLAGKLIFDIA
jgi:hypothetical protein